MSELRPTTPVTRPENARPREDAEPVIDPPGPGELVGIERHLAGLPAHGGAIVVEDPGLGVMLVRQSGGEAVGNYAAMPRWTADGWRDSLERVAATMRGWRAWPSLLLTDGLDRPPGLAEAIGAAGWSEVGRETALWVGRASVVPHLDRSMRIEAVQASGVAAHEQLERQIFGLPAERGAGRRASLAAALAGGRLRAYIVRVNEEPVAVARLSQGDGVAGIYAVGVAEGWRGKGYGTLLTTVATRAGMALGNRLVWLSVEDGNVVARHVYEKLGFQPAFSWARWVALAE